jgi:hypothetical protein
MAYVLTPVRTPGFFVFTKSKLPPTWENSPIPYIFVWSRTNKASPMRFFRQVWHLYYDGFKNMGSVGKRLWLIVLIKLFIMFAILRLFFFPDIMEERFSNDRERSDHIINEITKP